MIAVIAGTGSLPGEACKHFLASSQPFFVITLFPENNAIELKNIVHGNAEVIARDCYKPSEILSLLKEKSATKVLWIGKVDKSHLLKHVKFDWLALKILGSLISSRTDKDVMERLVTELANHGIQVIKQDTVLGGLRINPGILTGTLSDQIKTDITFGLKTALNIAHANIGQTVVVKDAMVLAVEAIEGTDACIQRGIQHGKEGVVICKAARLDQNRKFDLPTLGPSTIASLQKGQVSAIAWISDCTLIAQKDTFITQAKSLDILLTAVDAQTLV
jgi:DUF1009 family protein